MRNVKLHKMELPKRKTEHQTMKKIFFVILVLVTASYSVYSQNNEYESDKVAIINFLIKYCSFTDCEPTMQEEADSIIFFVKTVFEQQYTSENVPDLINQALHLLYDNSISQFTDAPDVGRFGIRRYMCFIALAFLSDENGVIMLFWMMQVIV
jgi:hypothetical protein